MKDYRLMLLGIAILLFGISCELLRMGLDAGLWILFLGRVMPFVGIVVVIAGAIKAGEKS